MLLKMRYVATLHKALNWLCYYNAIVLQHEKPPQRLLLVGVTFLTAVIRIVYVIYTLTLF